MQNWNSQLITEIYDQKNKEKSEDRDNLLRLISRSLYGETIHYALELIQNAEDQGSSFISFIFDSDKAVVVNDGKFFDEQDVWGICSVKTGRKRKKIGFFGIGFKAVFNVTKTPQIISNNFNFELNDFIYPKTLTSTPEIANKYYSTDKGAIFVLPYASDLALPKDLIENFSLIDEKLLLFLESIRNLEFVDNIDEKSWSIERHTEGESVFLTTKDGHETKYSHVSLINTFTEKQDRWLVFNRDLPVIDASIIPEGKQGIEKTRVTIAFPLDDGTREEIKRTGVVYCYLPTKKRTDLPFLIQADFLPTIGRENIAEHSWNTWLMKELGILAADAIDHVKNTEALSFAVYDFIPLIDEVQDEVVKQLFNSLFQVLKGKEIAKVSGTGKWVKPAFCAIPNDDRLRHILSEQDLGLLFSDSVLYIHPSLSKEESFTRAENVILELGATEISLSHVVDFVQYETLLLKKGEEWFLEFYDYLRTNFDTSKKSYKGDFPWNWEEPTKSLFKKLETSKFLLTDKKEVASLKDPTRKDRLICYPQSIDLSEVHSLFIEGEIIFLDRYFQESSITHRKEDRPEVEEKRKQVKEWFDDIGVRKYIKQSHIIREVILPKFTSGKYKEYDDIKLYNLLDYVRTYWSTMESEIQNKKLSSDILNDIRKSVLVKAICKSEGKSLNDYKSPEEVYFSSRYGKNEAMEELFEDIAGIYFLSPYYLNREKKETKKKKQGRQKIDYTWKKFFEILGIWSSPKVVKEEKWVSIRGVDIYEWVEKQYSPSGFHELYGDSFSEDINKLIEHCHKNEDKNEVHRRMVILWNSLADNWKFYKDREYCRTKYKWMYHVLNVRDYETSSFLELLRQAGWVPTKYMGFDKPSELYPYTPKNVALLGNNLNYVDLKASEVFLKDLEIKIEPSINEVVSHLENFRETNPHPSSNQIEKMRIIYCFLQDKLKSIADANKKRSMEEMVRTAFAEFELLYLPREDKVWWKPKSVFLKDYSELFEKLCGYIEHKSGTIYDDTLESFFSLLGVSERLSVTNCLDILENLIVSGDLSKYKSFASKVYSVIENIIKEGRAINVDWDRKVFLSENGQFLAPANLYYCDDNEFKIHFTSKIETMWLPFHWDNIKGMLSTGGFNRLGKSISIKKKFDNLKEIDGAQISQLIQRLSCVKNYLIKKKYDLFIEFQKTGIIERIDLLESFEAPTIILDYLFQKDGELLASVCNIEKDVFFSKEENRLYKSEQIALMSTPVAKELSKLFAPSEDEVFWLLDSLFKVADEEFDKKLEDFGIKNVQVYENRPSEEVEIIDSEGKELDVEEFAEHKEEHLQKGNEVKQKPFISLAALPPNVGVIDPNDFMFDNDIEEHKPYTKMDGPLPEASTKIIKLKEAQKGGKRGWSEPRFIVSRLDTQGAAIEIVMRFEEIEGREAEDRHDQLRIGYDVYSKSDDGSELFIEVKSYRGEAGSWELTPHEWKKAEEEKDRYFVYVVTGLREGEIPIIEIIQNPVKYLTPEPPVKKIFTDWKNGILKTVKLQKI